MKKFLLFVLSLLVGIGLFFWIGRTVGWEAIKNALSIFTGRQGLVILALTILAALVGAWKWKEILKGEGAEKIPFKSIFAAYIAGYSIMFLAPILVFGGEILRAYILKEKKFISWKKGMALVTIDRILEWTVNLTVIFFGIVFFAVKIGLPPENLRIIFGGAFLLFFAGICYFYFKVFQKESIMEIIMGWLGVKKVSDQNSLLIIEKEIFNFFKPKKKPMWTSLGLSVLRAAITYFRMWLIIMFLGKKISVAAGAAILGFTYLATIIPIPTALGSHEALQIFAFNSLGIDSSVATAFTMIIRGAELIIALAGLFLLARFSLGLLKKVFMDKVEKVAEENGLAE